MFSKRVIVTAAMLTLVAVVIATRPTNGRAQSKGVPNLSGTWALVEHDGTRKSYGGSNFPVVTLLIQQQSPEIRITQKTVRRGVEKVLEFIYYADERGETNTGQIKLWPSDFPRLDSVTRWSKDKLLTRYKAQIRVMAGYPLKSSDVDAKEEWRLASDGTKLVLTSSSSQIDSPSADGKGQSDLAPRASFSTSKLVFKKVL